MSRTEKIVAFLLGTLVFAGLFVFIFTSLRTPPASPPLGDAAAFGDEEEPFDFNVDGDTETFTNDGTMENEIPAAAPAKPAPVKKEKK